MMPARLRVGAGSGIRNSHLHHPFRRRDQLRTRPCTRCFRLDEAVRLRDHGYWLSENLLISRRSEESSIRGIAGPPH